MKKPESLGANIIFLISDAQRLIYNKIVALFYAKQFEPTPEQFAILTFLWYSDGSSQQAISNALNRDKTTITRVLANMEKHNLIVRIKDKIDTRQRLVYLTQKGKIQQQLMMETSAPVYVKALEGIDEAEIEVAIKVINKIIINLQQTK